MSHLWTNAWINTNTHPNMHTLKFQIKYTEEILSNSTRKLLRLKVFIIILGTLSFPVADTSVLFRHAIPILAIPTKQKPHYILKCYHKSVCLSVVRCVSTHLLGCWNFLQHFYAILHLSHLLTFMQQQQTQCSVLSELAFRIVIVAHRNTIYRRFWNAYESGTLMWLEIAHSVGIAHVRVMNCPRWYRFCYFFVKVSAISIVILQKYCQYSITIASDTDVIKPGCKRVY